jgi:predicted glycosyltransferase
VHAGIQKMRILVDLNHPAQVHLFRNAIREWQKLGHEVLIAARDKDITLQLLQLYGLDYIKTARSHKGWLSFPLGVLELDWKIWRLARRFDPDWMIGTSFAIAHVSKLVRGRSIVFAEDAVKANRLFWLLVDPFADFIATPDVLTDDHGPRHLRYPSYQKMAYLHPKRFKPDQTIFKNLGIKDNQAYSLFRFVAFKASHDVGHQGLNEEIKSELISHQTAYGPVFISSETPLPESLRRYELDISPARVHDVLAYASVLISESASMVTEAAILGTPAVYCSSLVGSVPVLNELETKFGLVFQFQPSDSNRMVRQIKRLMDMPNIRDQWQSRREKLLAKKIDLTDWIVNLPQRLQDKNASFTVIPR